MKPRHTAALALVGAVSGLLVPICYLALFKLGITQSMPYWLIWLWPSALMLLALDLCCGQHAPTSEVVRVLAESIAVNMLIYGALLLGFATCIDRLQKILSGKSRKLSH
jgi:hypothetical protein